MIKARSLKKATAALPSSPSKKVETVKFLAKQFNLKVHYSNQNKAGRSSNTLTEEEIDWLKEFFVQLNITYVTPGIKDQKYFGKDDRESMSAQKRYLLWNIQDIFGILNLNSNEGGESSNSKFSKEITFRQLYGFINSQPQVVCNNNLAVCVRFVKVRFTFRNPF